VPQIEVTFDIDANGILHVSAKDKATGKEQKIRIEASSGLGEKDIEKMVKDAEAHAAEDKRRREEIERRNRLDTMVYEVEKSSKEWVDKLDAELKTRLDKAVEGAKQALRSGAADEIGLVLGPGLIIPAGPRVGRPRAAPAWVVDRDGGNPFTGGASPIPACRRACPMIWVFRSSCRGVPRTAPKIACSS